MIKKRQHSCHMDKNIDFFKTDEKSAREAQCDKSRALYKVVDTIINIGSFRY